MSVQRNSQYVVRRVALPLVVAGLVGCSAAVAAASDTIVSAGQDSQTRGRTTRRTMVVNVEATFVRERPHAQSSIIIRLERGARVEVLDDSGIWYRVRTGNPPHEGFVHHLVLSQPPRSIAPSPVSGGPHPANPVLPKPTTTSPGRPDNDGRRSPATQPTSTGGRSVVSTRSTHAGIGLRGLGVIGWMVPLARDSFDAVGITEKPLMVGGGGEVTNLYRGLFVRGTVERWSGTGERAFLPADGPRLGLGIPLTVKMTPIDITAGWRFARLGRGADAVTPYVGGGAGVLKYEETDPFAEASENVDTRFNTYHVLGGAEVGILRWLSVKVEYRYRAVPDSLGAGGVSKDQGDASLGGSTMGFAVVLGR
jgi:Bacterial SH3 domain